MKVRSFCFENFMSHTSTTIDMPVSGVVVVTGGNGAGKSSFVEGVAWAVWGKTLRGTSPWRGDGKPACVVDVTFDQLRVERARRGAKTELHWEQADQPAPEEFETPSKAQEALEHLAGPFDLWRKSHVFSSADAAHFTVATDGDRKRLIESFLGTNRFDPAVEACRKDLKDQEGRLADRERAQQVAQAKLDAASVRLREAKQGLAATSEPTPIKAKQGKALSDYDASISAARREVDGLRAQIRTADQAGAGYDQMARTAQSTLDKLRADKCPTCAQGIAASLRSSIQRDVNAAKGHAELARDKANIGRADIEAALDEINEEVQALSLKRAERAAELAAVERTKQEAERYDRQRALQERTRREADEQVFALTEELTALHVELEALRGDVDELTETEKVLGLKGVRANILGDSLSGIEAVANAWLARLRQADLRVKLSPYSESKKGNVSDSISLEVIGAGDGKGYKANSGGERRRVDVALLLALAEVAAASNGQEGGTLFFDEVFDCLDEDGIEAVASALTELAEDRLVMVITHSKELCSKLRSARFLRVHDGKAVWQ